MYNVYWGDEPNNFGDVLTKNLLDFFNISYTHTNSYKNANLFCIGSIARLATNKSIVLGSGIIRNNEFLNPYADWKFVRGPLTREHVLKSGGTCPEIYSDPALLLPLFCKESNKEYEVGIVPHYQDYKKIKKEYPNYKVINVVNSNPLDVAEEITKCKKIISSSLHGIICAHAYNIPSAYVQLSKLHGDGSKFYDFYLSVNISNPIISTIENPKYQLGKVPDLNIVEQIFKEMI
jgi:hypothetical protein